MRSLSVLSISCLVVLSFSCASEPAPEVVRAAAPSLDGKADGPSDQADRACRVVLRGIGRQPGDDGYRTICTPGGACNWVWEGTVEIDEALAAAGATVHVLYHQAGDPQWWQVDANQTTPYSQPGFVQYRFSLHEHLFGPSATEAALAAARIELIPLVRLADGTRLFDHNRNSGSFDNHALHQGNYFGLGDEGVCAPVFGRISFLDGWGRYQHGVLRQGGYLAIDYALERLPTCRGTHNGHPAWDIVAHVAFAPGGQLVSGSVRAFDSPQGTPTTVAHPKDLVVKIPDDATGAEIWFRNYTGAGSSCEAWDSNHGANYGHEIWPPASDPRCQDIEHWTTVHSDMPYVNQPHCLAYDVDEQHHADHCELYLGGIGHGYVGHYGIPQRWIEAYVTVGPQQGQLLGVGLLTRYRDQRTGLSGQRWTFGRQVSADTWQTGFIYHHSGMMGSGNYVHDVEQLAFFVDVERPSGNIVRLWQSRQGSNYRWDDAFSLPRSTEYIPYGRIEYADQAAAIFDHQRACLP